MLQFICLHCCFADVEMNEDKNEGSENEDCEERELEKATQKVHVNVSYCIFISTCINPSISGVLGVLKTKI